MICCILVYNVSNLFTYLNRKSFRGPATYVKTHKLSQVCKPVVVTSLKQEVNNLIQVRWRYQTCSKVVLISLIESCYNKNISRLIVSWLYRTCWNNLATSTRISSCYKLLTACGKLVDNLGQAVRKQLVDRLVTRCEIFTRVYGELLFWKCQSSIFLFADWLKP
jgi:hypothetical protein